MNASSPSTALPTALPARTVRLGDVTVDLASHLVRRPGHADLRLSPKAIGVLKVLLQQSDRPVHREALIDAVWTGQFRTDDVVTKAMQELRRALGEAPGHLVIETIPRVGYWLKLPFTWDDAAGPAAAESGARLATLAPDLAPARVSVRHARTWLSLVGLALTLLIWLRWPPPVAPMAVTAPPETRNLPSQNARPFSTEPGDERAAAMAPDGSVVAIVLRPTGEQNFRLYLRTLDGGSPRRLLNSAARGDELAPAWSPDGRQLAFFHINEGECALEVVDLHGLSPRHLATCLPDALRAPEFFPTGDALLLPWRVLAGSQRRPGLARLPLDGSPPQDVPLPALASTAGLHGRFAPDGSALLLQHGLPPFCALTRLDFDGRQAGTAIPLGERFNAIQGFTWLPDSRHAVLATDASGQMELWRIDTRSGVLQNLGGFSGEQPSAARIGTRLVYTRQERFSGLFELRRDGDRVDPPRPLFASTRSESAPALTPDGRSLAFVSERMGQPQLYLGDLDTGEVRPLGTMQDGRPFGLSFSSDGKLLAFAVRDGAQTQPWILDLTTLTRTHPQLGVARAMDLRFGAQPGALLYTGWDSAGQQPFPYAQQLGQPDSALRLGPCSGRAPRAGPGGQIHFFAPERRVLQRLDLRNGEARCVDASAHVRWHNHQAWVASEQGLLAVLRASDGVPAAGLYALADTPRLLLALPGLEDSGAIPIELVGDARRLIVSLPVKEQTDIWLLEVASGPALEPAP